MKINKLIILILSCLACFVLKSCNGCSRSGRVNIIAKAQQEAQKNKTIPNPKTINKNKNPKVVKIEDVLTPREKKIIKKELIDKRISPAIGELIQVEGLVLKEVSELNIKLKTSGSQIEQIMTFQNYVQNNWHYIFDPLTGKDTWRSAEATLSLKYKGQYSGDCDDFAILLASMAKQIGLRSRMIGGFDGTNGHAFAEFLLPSKKLNEIHSYSFDYREDINGKWISLDWFKGPEHEKYTKNIKIIEGI